MRLLILSFTAILMAPLALPQDTQKATVPFSDPSRPRRLEVVTMFGSVTVRGYNGQEAIVETSSRDGIRAKGRKEAEPPAGMHRIGGNYAGVEITEENNTIRVSGGQSPLATADLVIQVPVQTSVSVNAQVGNAVTIENITGEIEANNMNGPLTITNVSGSVMAHSLNGKILASVNSVTPDKAMSFSTMNGEIDVTLPASIKANVKLKTDHGDIFTDFDVKLDSTARPPQVEDNRKKGGKYRVRFDRGTTGTINGGGPEIQFTTFNGSILIHKK
ncbi:MAG: DUF4097 family beta strand repeat-containing protein [Terriglobales bacterium]